MIKDLSKEQSSSPLGSLLLAGASSESTTDAMLLSVYIESLDMFNLLEQEFNLSAYYSSAKIDILHRLFKENFLGSYLLNNKNLLSKYHDDLLIIYDDPSSTLKISFAHSDPKVAQQIVERIVFHASEALNTFEKKNTEIVLKFLKKQEREKHKQFTLSLKRLLNYQNKHNTIDPKIDIESKSTILAGLESDLIQKNVEYNSKAQYLNKLTPEMKLLKGNMSFIQKSINKIKREITGTKGKSKLNANMSDFTRLKSNVDFDKQVYMQILFKLEETKVLISQNTKNLIVVTKANIADSYTYPNKVKDSFSILLILSFLYGIISLTLAIIRDHKD